LQRVLALEPQLDLDDWRRLTPVRVNLLLRMPRGFVLFSETTLADDPATAPIHIRRLLILLRRLALREGDRFVFAPNDLRLRDLVRHRFEAMLASLYARGAFAGRDASEGFRVLVDDSVNPPSSVARGRFIIELQVAPARALAFITVRLTADERGRLAFEETSGA
jgi:phage tail sheath protein FI